MCPRSRTVLSQGVGRSDARLCHRAPGDGGCCPCSCGLGLEAGCARPCPPSAFSPRAPPSPRRSLHLLPCSWPPTLCSCLAKAPQSGIVPHTNDGGEQGLALAGLLKPARGPSTLLPHCTTRTGSALCGGIPHHHSAASLTLGLGTSLLTALHPTLPSERGL